MDRRGARADARGTRTLQEWDADNNNVKLTEAAGSADQAVTEMEYDDNGMLTERTDPEDHATVFEYKQSPGILLADSGDDSGGGFVSDLISVTRPNEFELGGDYTTEFELDERGNREARIEPDGHRGETDFDARGQIEAERDERNRETTYPAYDPNGMALEKVDPRGGRWRYTYDPVGNLLTATDPRGGEGERFRTTLTYDALDRMTGERKPKDSENGEFVERETEYDRNGNIEAKVDGEGERWETDYTATDKPRETRSPATEHVGADGEPEQDDAREITEMRYDEEDNPVEETRPKGVAGGAEEAYTTATTYNEVSERVAEVRRSRGGQEEDEDIATSWAYDRRGNVVGEVDGNRNERFGGAPEENAEVPARRRFTYECDKAARRTAAVEDPGGLALRTETEYDADGNKVAETDPRGFESDASAEDYTTSWEYNNHDLKIAEVDPEGGRSVWEYYPDDAVKSETSLRGSASSAVGDFTTRYEYWETGELRTKALPRAEDQYGPALVVEYGVDAVGNPTSITDARGNEFANRFYDTGELKWTERPSWWAYRGDPQPGEGDGEEEASAETAMPEGEPMADKGSTLDSKMGGAATSGMPADDATPAPNSSDPSTADGEPQAGTAETEAPTPEIAERGPAPSDGKPEALPESKGQGDFGSVNPEPMPGLMPKKGPTTLTYDSEMRLTEVRNEPSDGGQFASTLSYDSTGRMTEKKLPLEAAAGRHITTATGYDRHGNVVRTTDGETNEDGEENQTITTYDQFDRPVRVAAPGGDADTEEVTVSTYDENGNEVSRQTPRGTAFTAHMAYDALDRLVSERNPAGEETTSTYDGAANKSSETSPRGNELPAGDSRRAGFTTRYEHDGRGLMTKTIDGLGQETTMVYDENGNQTETTAPGAARAPGAAEEPRVVARTYDGRDLPWTETTGTGEDARTRVTEYDGNGNLRRQVNPAGVDESAEPPRALSEDSGGQVTQNSEATKNATVREYSREDLLTSVHLPWGERDADDRRRYRQDLTRDGRGRVASIDAAYEWTDPDAETSRTSYTHYDTGWIKTSTDPTLVDPDSGEQAGGRAFTYAYDRRGLQLTWASDEKRSVRREFAPNATMTKRTAFKPNTVARTYDYSYNENRSMTEMVDQQLNRTTDIGYDAAERETLVDETWSAGRDTKTGYDANGNVVERRTDGTASGSGYDGGRTTTYTFDELDRETDMVVDEGGGSANTYLTAYHPSGEVRSQRRPSSVDEQTFYRTDANVSQMRSGASGEALNKDQAYAYDRNSNRTQDERGIHAFNARDQLVSWTRGAGQPGAGTAVTYELDGTGQITREQDGAAVTDSRYNGDRLLSQTEAAPSEPTLTRRFAYDDLGAITEETKQVGSAEPTVETRYLYDAFERMVSASGPAAEDDATYTYDGLDRRDKKVEGSTTRDFSYVGLTEELSREQAEGETRLYEYDSSGEREGLTADGGSSSSLPEGRQMGRSTPSSPRMAPSHRRTSTPMTLTAPRKVPPTRSGRLLAATRSASRASTTTPRPRRTTCRPGSTGRTSGGS